MKEYPYIFYPQHSPSEQKLIPTKNSKTGFSESFFEEKFLSYFKNYVNKNVIIDDGKSRPYYPDYVLHIPEYNLYVDIEIDEPYSLRGNTPIHTNDEDKDEVRNQYFLNKGWGIIRFAEVQIAKFPQLCCKVISEYVRNVSGDHIWLEGFHESGDLEIFKAWSTEDSRLMATDFFRQKYFNLLKTVKQAKPSVSILVDGIYLNNEIRNTIRALKNNKIKSFNKSVRSSLFLKLLSHYFGHFKRLDEIKGKIFIELTVFISNHHSIEGFSFGSELVVVENYLINIYYIRTHDLICFSVYDKIIDEKLDQVILIADDPAYPPLLETINDTEFILIRNYHNTAMSPFMIYISINSLIENSLQIKYH